jgi:hypothetical protein
MPVLPGSHCRYIMVCGILLLLCSSTIKAEPGAYNPATGDYRPLYNFSYAVFQNLPKVPMDFWTRKAVFDQQEVPASHLTPEYYLQPELFPGWAVWHDKIYGENRTIVGVYGASMYPSRFDIFDMKPMETANVSALLYTAFGVEVYQGAELVAIYNNTTVRVRQTAPELNVFLLTPTYPKFNATWCRVVVYEITLLKEKNTTIEIMETAPPDDFNDRYNGLFGNKYISGGSILGLRVPKVKIYIHSMGTGNGTGTSEANKQESRFPYYLLIIPLVGIVAVLAYAGLRSRKKKLQRVQQQPSPYEK